MMNILLYHAQQFRTSREKDMESLKVQNETTYLVIYSVFAVIALVNTSDFSVKTEWGRNGSAEFENCRVVPKASVYTTRSSSYPCGAEKSGACFL